MVTLYLMLLKRGLVAGLIVVVALLAADLGVPALRDFHEMHRLIVDISVWVLAAAMVFTLAPIRLPKS